MSPIRTVHMQVMGGPQSAGIMEALARAVRPLHGSVAGFGYSADDSVREYEVKVNEDDRELVEAAVEKLRARSLLLTDPTGHIEVAAPY